MFSRSDQEDLDGENGDLIPYLMTKTDLTEQEVMTLISEFFFAGVDTVSPRAVQRAGTHFGRCCRFTVCPRAMHHADTHSRSCTMHAPTSGRAP